jgi:hypothetical protein
MIIDTHQQLLPIHLQLHYIAKSTALRDATIRRLHRYFATIWFQSSGQRLVPAPTLVSS